MISLMVESIMVKKVVTFKPTDQVVDIAKVMSKNKISCVVIVKNKKPIGLLTERDVIKKIVSKNLSTVDLKAKDIMTTKLMTISSKENIFRAAHLMQKKHIRRLPVVDKGKLVGLITETDVVKAMTRIAQMLNKELIKYITNA